MYPGGLLRHDLNKDMKTEKPPYTVQAYTVTTV